jgi:uncharacterized protein involved in exopolysaccharide biosynthesis/Mrp family chromosome partitioning ATPase
MNDLILRSQSLSGDPLLGAVGTSTAPRAMHASPRDLLFVLFWHRRRVVVFFVVALLLTALAVIAMPSTYRSESTLLVKVETVTNDPTAAISGPMIQPVMQRDMQMKTELEVLKSREISEAVVNALGAKRLLRSNTATAVTSEADATEDPVFRQAMIALGQNMTLEIASDSNVLRVAYESGDPKLARDVTAAYVQQYLMHRTKVYANAANATFLRGEREATQKKIIALEEQIRTIKDTAGVGNVDEQRQILQQRIGAMQAGVTEARTLRVSADAEVAALQSQMKIVPAKIVTQTTLNASLGSVDALRKDINTLELQLADAQSRYMPGSTQVRVLEEKIIASRQLLSTVNDSPGERIEAVNPTYKELEARLESAKTNAEVYRAKEQAMLGEILSAETDLKRVNDVELRVKSLLRSANLSETTLATISKAADQAGLVASYQHDNLNNVSIVQPATMPLRAIAPNRLMLLVLGLFVAGTGAIGLGIASETLSRTTKRPEDVDRLTSLPCVSVPVVDNNGFMGHAPAMKMSRLAGLLPGKKQPPRGSTTVVTRTAGTAISSSVSSTASSSVRTSGTGADVRPLRRWSPQLLQSAHGVIDGLLFDVIRQSTAAHAFTTGIISCRPGQGASTLSAYIASAIADRLEASLPLHPNDHVLLIDTDLAEPTLHRMLSLNDTPGVGDWLSAATDQDSSIDAYIQQTSHPRLSLMPGGRANNVTRLLDRVDRLLDEATRNHRHIVLDLPPVSSTPTALRLAAKCDAVLVVIECGNLHQEVVRKNVRALQAAGANVTGVVLNKRRFPIPDWLYERSS